MEKVEEQVQSKGKKKEKKQKSLNFDEYVRIDSLFVGNEKASL